MTPREKELYRLVLHTLFCFDHDCAKCMDIERQIEDGPQHFPEDPQERIDVALSGVALVHEQAKRLADFLESSKIPASVFRSAVSIVDNLERVTAVLGVPNELRVVEDSGKPVGLLGGPPKPRRRRAVTAQSLAEGDPNEG